MSGVSNRASSPGAMEAYFHDIAATLDRLLAAGELYTAVFGAEVSDFVRMNRGRVRQPGTVVQRSLDVDLIRGARHATQRLALSGDTARDRQLIAAAVASLRDALPDVDDDPHLLYSTDVQSSRAVRGEALPAAEAIIDTVLAAARGVDFVGLYAGGAVCRGFANALGQRNWHEATSFNLQWSLYHRADKAVRTALSGFAWDERAFAAKMTAARASLADIARPPRRLEPGAYRAYLAPAAMEELLGLLSWGSFSARALATRQSPLLRMQDGAGDAELDARVTLAESTTDAVAPAFQSEGFVRPARVPLIESGRLAGSLCSPRTAREFDLATNGANASEMPEALSLAGGDLSPDDVLAALDTGLAIGNLWYMNFSDRPACRMTGMTRFATFWVERGRIVAPADVLRFDDTLYRMLGSNLEALTREPELMLDGSTYAARSLASTRTPGALVREIAFTL
jgi:predicted Zn-dependent protease